MEGQNALGRPTDRGFRIIGAILQDFSMNGSCRGIESKNLADQCSLIHFDSLLSPPDLSTLAQTVS
jgi:hypothetical protein